MLKRTRTLLLPLIGFVCPVLSGVFQYFSVLFESSPFFLVEFLFMKQIKLENIDI